MNHRFTHLVLRSGTMSVTLGLHVIMIVLLALAGFGVRVSAEELPLNRETGVERPSTYFSLADVWALAEQNHPDVQEARRELAAREREVRQRQAVYSPNVTLRVEGPTLSSSPGGSFGLDAVGVSVNAGLTLPSGLSVNASVTAPSERSWSTEDGGSLRGSISARYPLSHSAELDNDAVALQQALVSLEAARRQFELLPDDVRAQVLDALHKEQVANVRLHLAREAYNEALEAWSRVEERVEAGIDSEGDLFDAQLELMRAQLEQIVATRTWESRRRQLAELLGLDDDEIASYQFENVLGWTDLPETRAVASVIEAALDQSVIVWERRQAEETARQQLEAERARSGVDAGLRAGYQPPGVTDGRPGWSIGLEVSYPLMDGGQRRLALEAREDAFVRAKTAREEAERDVRTRVRELLIELEQARLEAEMARLEVELAQRELAAVERQAGLPVSAASTDEVQRARRAALRADVAWREAVQRYQASWVELQRMQGPVPWDELVHPARSGEYQWDSAAEGMSAFGGEGLD